MYANNFEGKEKWVNGFSKLYKVSSFFYLVPGLYILFNLKKVQKIIPELNWCFFGFLLLLNACFSYLNDVKFWPEHEIFSFIDIILALFSTILCTYYSLYVNKNDCFILFFGMLFATYCRYNAIKNANLNNQKQFEKYHILWHVSIPLFGTISLMYLNNKK